MLRESSVTIRDAAEVNYKPVALCEPSEYCREPAVSLRGHASVPLRSRGWTLRGPPRDFWTV
eukprot:4980116-Alexandrium_andersonii.AAC.1